MPVTIFSFYIFPVYTSAFTVRDQAEGPISGTIKFNNVITNIGKHFKTSTGQYICEYPGIYVFTLHIYLISCVDLAHCYIRKNSINIIRAYVDPNVCGYFEASNSAVLHLSRGEIVDIGGCSSVGSMWGWTSFSGFLLKAD